MAHELPPLPYDYTALEPIIDEKTMHLHHDMHHAAYVKNLNAALDKHPELHAKSPEDLIRDLNATEALTASSSPHRVSRPRWASRRKGDSPCGRSID